MLVFLALFGGLRTARIGIINFGKIGAINLELSKPANETLSDPVKPSLVSRNPVVRIYDKVATLNQLQRELNGQPPLPMNQLRPTSMQLQVPANVSEENVLQKIEEDLDKNIASLQKTLADSPSQQELALAKL